MNQLLRRILLPCVLLGKFTCGFAEDGSTTFSVANLLVENRQAPVGIDTRIPRFTWQLHGHGQGLRQTAYHLQVAAVSADQFTDDGKKLAWDSGWITSDQSLLVAYAGAPLRSNTPYVWRVQVKDATGNTSAWSTPSRWVTGLLDVERELTADWIGFDHQAPGIPNGSDWFNLKEAEWICSPNAPTEKKSSSSIAWYRTQFTVPSAVLSVQVGMELNFTGQFFINGKELFQGGRFGSLSYLDVTPWVHSGVNQLGVRVNEVEDRDHPGLIAVVRIEQPNNQVTYIYTDKTWETTSSDPDLWAKDGRSGKDWVRVKVLGKPGSPNLTKRGDDKLFSPIADKKIGLPPAVYLRKELTLSKPIRSAIFHGTAQGLYDLYVNGQRVTPTGFQPGWTQFEIHTSYVSTDVTELLKPGANAIGAVLADGYFRGNLLWFGREKFGEKTRFSGQLVLNYADNSQETMVTDGSWKASFGPLQQSDIMFGEVYDARREQLGWDSAGFDDHTWEPVTVTKRSVTSNGAQRAHPTEPVAIEMELSAQAITEPKPGVYVVDFGQNFAGWTKLSVIGKPGQVIYLRFAEDLNPDGTIYTDNLRSINPADRYICKGGDREVWEPRFTYHGFRYVQILGLEAKPDADFLKGIVAHSGGPITSTFSSSSSMLNRLYQNVQWSQRSNYFETMTDCPQRDERYGWVGDAHFFMRSSVYNQTGASFFTKWFLDCVDTQDEKSHNISNGAPGYKPDGGNAQLDWSAAMMITPWMIWQHYGDQQPISENYDALRKYMTQWEGYAKTFDPNYKGKDFKIIGDWVSIEKGTDKNYIGGVFGYILSLQMVDFAQIMKNDQDIKTFTNLAEKFKTIVVTKFIKPTGEITGNTQTAYALAARNRLFAPELETLIRERFKKVMEEKGYQVLTGFNGTGNLLQGLSEIGLDASAGKTILNEKYPGWGAMVKAGATTIWEHWDSKTANGSWANPHMNSFNHYTFGGCGEWMMGWLVGLRSAAPGCKIIRVQPSVISGLDWVAGSFVSPYGTTSNRWERTAKGITMHLEIPPNSSGLVFFPPQAKMIKNGNQNVVLNTGGLQIEAGRYEFTWLE